MLIHSLALMAPLLLLLAAWQAFRHPGARAGNAPLLAEFAALGALAVAFIGLAFLWSHGAATSPVLGARGLGIAVRLDALSVTMLVLVAFVGWVVLRFARSYMDGDAYQGRFTAWLCLTLAAVMGLVTAGSLLQLVACWVATSAALHRLLLHYPERAAAQRAARKKFLCARAGDLALGLAAILLFASYGTGNIAAISEAAHEGQASSHTWVIALLLALAALLKSAQFPTQGWLTEVMETPTPVSALLHAGVINAGGFLLIRFADVLLHAPLVLALLVMIGGFTAMLGALVMLTQSAVKTSLAWSTVGQMGFLILQCGLALFPLALLHIVAHSLYKAHAFLASGSAIDDVAAIRRPGPIAVPDVRAVARAFLIAIALYAVVAFAFGTTGKSPQALALGAILVFGVVYLLAQGLADEAPRALTLRTTLYAAATASGYFALHSVAGWLMAGTLPPAPPAGPLEWALIVLAVTSFGVVAVAQSLFPLWATHPAAAGIRVHLFNGLYANAVFDRLIGGWRLQGSGERS